MAASFGYLCKRGRRFESCFLIGYQPNGGKFGLSCMLGIFRVVTVANVVVAYNWNEITPACFISVLTAVPVCELEEMYLELHNC